MQSAAFEATLLEQKKSDLLGCYQEDKKFRRCLTQDVIATRNAYVKSKT